MRKVTPGIIVTSVTGLVLLLLSLTFAYDKLASTYSFGFEYGNIAASVVEGRGYGGPFDDSVGPSAWMLPVNTLVYIAIFTVFGVKTTAAMWACIVTNCVLWSFCAYFLYQTGRLFAGRLALIAVVALVCLLLLHRTIITSLFDYALLNLLTIATVYFLYHYLYYQTHYWALLGLALILPLASPGLFLAFALLLIVRFTYLLIQRKGFPLNKNTLFRSHYSKIVYLGLASVTVMSVWGFRNYQDLGRFIPSKSNFWYEFYQANMADDDGIVNSRTFRTFHPSVHGQYRSLYDSLGEMGFVDYMAQRSQEEFLLPDYLERVGRRAYFAFVYSPNSGLKLPADTAAFPAEDEVILHWEGLMQNGDWISLDVDSAVFVRSVRQLSLHRKAAITSDWVAKKATYDHEMSDLGSFVREASVSLIPFLCIVLGFFVRTIRVNPLFQLTVTIYCIQLLPYVLVSHYLRYQYYLLALQALLMLLATNYVITLLTKKSGRGLSQSHPVRNASSL